MKFPSQQEKKTCCRSCEVVRTTIRVEISERFTMRVASDFQRISVDRSERAANIYILYKDLREKDNGPDESDSRCWQDGVVYGTVCEFELGLT